MSKFHLVFSTTLCNVYPLTPITGLSHSTFQALSIALTILCLLIFLISLAAHAGILYSLAEDLGNVNTKQDSQTDLDAQLAAFTVLFTLCLCIGIIIQAFFGEVNSLEQGTSVLFR